jgi:hypothetical protein
MTTAEVLVGIDVSKARLDVAVGSAGELFAVDNDARGIAGLAGRLRKLGSELIVLEAGGGLSAVTRPVNFALIAVVSTDYRTRMFYAKSQTGITPSADVP